MMTTPFDAAVTLAEQLSPPEQARLVLLLAERLQHTLSAEQRTDAASSPEAAEEPAFWQLPAIDAEWATLQAGTTQLRQTSAAQAATQAMLTGWFGAPLPEAEALELAMSEELSEWNLDR